jgi:hypothetical protein
MVDRLELRGDRDEADAGCDGEGPLPPGEAEGLEGAMETGHLPFGFGKRAAGHEHGELVAAQPGHEVGLAHGVLEQGGHPAEELVAGEMAAGVVDDLELVEVQVAEGVVGAAGAGLLQGALEVPIECLAVEQAGQLVVSGLVGELEAEQAPVAHVLEDDHGAHDAAVQVADRGAGALDGVAAAVAALQGETLGQPEVDPFLETAMDQGVHGLAARLVGQAEDLGQRPGQGLGLAPAGELLSHRVHVLDVPIGVGGEDAVADGGQGDLGQLLLGEQLRHLVLVGAGGMRQQVPQDGVVELVRVHQGRVSESSTRIAVWL